MGAEIVLKPARWFSNRSLRLSLHRRSSKSSSASSSPPSPSCSLQPKGDAKEDELKQVFRHFDSDGDGKISALELRAYFGSIQEYMSHEEAQAAINDLDTDGDNLLDFQDFVKLMQREDGNQEDLKRAFEMFELEKGSGCITPKGLQRMFNRLGDEKSYDECVAMIQVFDIDGNGVLDFQEFHQMMA
uniref:Calmodulin-like protein 41a n=1 Tax=Vitis amurensis TaxID=103351 RepID=A0A6B9WAY7_9ROSI|nr:calmodulin-like protein 41a [Vitis amurensis]